jgi:uncharacterized damage-inducible protein DinB
MISPEYCQTMARYNAWMNEKLYASAAQLSDAQRKQNLKAFFRSLHSTLNHLMVGDGAWIRRFDPQCTLPYDAAKATSLDVILFDDFSALTAARVQLDAAISQFASAVSAGQLAAPLTYRRITGQTTTVPFAAAVTHFFNHQTHHRGQVTTLLSQFGIDPGVTDLVWMPGVIACA